MGCDLLVTSRDRFAGLMAQRTAIKDTVKGFCEACVAEFAPKERSGKLPFWKVTFRVSEKTVVPNGMEEIVIRMLPALRSTDFVRTAGKCERKP